MSNLCNGNLKANLSVGRGEDGKSLEFIWQGTNLGVRQEGEAEYQFVNLASEFEFRVYEGYLQCKNKNENEWSNLITITELQGANGKSAYEIWLEEGNEGAVEDFLLSLKGNNGDKGDKGEQGLPGRDGRDGIDGQDGANGRDGVTPNITIGTVTTLEAGQQATATITGTTENPILNLGIPRGDTGKPSVEDSVYVPIIDGVLNLTTDKIQTTDMEDNTIVLLPRVEKYTVIHLFFDTTSELTLTFPRIKWQGDISIEANKSYEFIFTYQNGSWKGGCVCYA